MTLSLADRVLETSSTQGTGTYNLDGPATGFQSFIAGAGSGTKVPYIADDGTNWEIGVGTLTGGTPDTLARTSVLASSNAGAAVNWGPGTRNMRLGPVAKAAVMRDASLNFSEFLATAGGTADAHTLTYTPAKLGYSNGEIICYVTSAGPNTGAVTVNKNGLGAKALKFRGADMPPNALPAGWLVLGRYSSSLGWYEMISQPSPGAGIISPAQLTANTDNWNPTNLTNSSEIRFSTDASRNLTGIVAQPSGTLLVLTNIGSNNLVLTHDATSTAANRFSLPGSTDFTVSPGASAILKYDGTSSRWRLIGSALAAATSADQEAATSAVKFVSPAVQHSHPSAAKFWGKATVSAGVPAISGSYNLTSITDDGTGLLTATIANDFSSGAWGAWIDIERNSSTISTTANHRYSAVKSGTQNAGAISFECWNTSGYADPDVWHFGGFGDQ